MNAQLFQATVTLASVHIALDTLYWVVMLFHSTITPLLSREPPGFEQATLTPQRFHGRMAIARMIQRIAFFFPIRRTLTILEWTSHLHHQNQIHSHHLVWARFPDLFVALIWPGWFHDVSLLAWETCLFWLFMLDRLMENDDTDGPENDNDGDKPEESDPTPTGDAAEQWLHSLQKGLGKTP